MSNSMKRAIKKSKFLPDDLEDFLDAAKLAKETCKTKKPQKRQQVLEPVDEDLSETAEPLQPISKKNKVPLEVETGKIVQEKVLKAMETHLNARQEGYDTMLKKLSDVIGQMKVDNSALKSNQQKLVHLTSSVIKCMEQVSAAQEQKLQELTEIFASFKKQCEEIESEHQAETNKLAAELKADILKLQQKLVSETKRSGWETLRKTIFQAMQNDF